MQFDPELPARDSLSNQAPAGDISLPQACPIEEYVYDRLDGGSASILLRKAYRGFKKVKIIAPHDLPYQALELINECIFDATAASRIDSKLSLRILAGAFIQDPEEVFFDGKFYAVIVCILNKQRKYVIPMPDDARKTAEYLVDASTHFGGFILNIAADFSKAECSPVTGPSLTFAEITKITSGDLSGVIGLDLTEELELAEINPNQLTEFRNLNFNKHTVSLIADLSSNQVCAYSWGDKNEIFKSWQFFYLFDLDQGAFLNKILNDSLPAEELGYSIIEGLNLQFDVSPSKPVEASFTFDDAQTILRSLNSEIQKLLQVYFPGLTGEFKCAYAWEETDDTSVEVMQLTILANLFDQDHKIITPGAEYTDSSTHNDTLSGIAISVVDFKRSFLEDHKEASYKLASVDSINLHPALWQKELLKLTSAEPSSSMLYGLILKQLDSFCLELGIRTPSKGHSVLLRQIDPSSDFDFLGLFRTSTGDFLFMLDIEEDGCGLNLKDGISIVHFFAFKEEIKCRKHLL